MENRAIDLHHDDDDDEIEEEMQIWGNDHNNNNDPNNNNNNDMFDHEVDVSDDDNDNNDHPDDNDNDNDENHQGPRLNADGTLDGGVAWNPNDPDDHNNPNDDVNPRRRSGSCDLILIVECHEPIHVAPDHPLLKPGVRISIGLDKNTKLQSVFTRFVAFLAQHHPAHPVTLHDVEFAHVQLLHGQDTAETSALMKYDVIAVRNVQTEQREADAEDARLQREADGEFFQKMRFLLTTDARCDVVLDCRGTIQENGLNQKVLATGVRAHAGILTKRCPWLGNKIQAAKEELERNTLVTLADHGEEEHGLVLRRGAGEVVARAAPDAAQIGSSDDDDPARSDPGASRLLWVTLSNHPPDAVRLLLEYCYTHRVVALGQDAFFAACKTKGETGPIPPFDSHSSRSREWPHTGLPTISVSVALSAIRLAEEAQLPRFSLMCEVAASQLVQPPNVVDALTLCTMQSKTCGNPLARLRKAAMDQLFGHGKSGVERPTFRRALQEKSDLVVPSLLIGTMEALLSKKTKNVRSPTFPYLDLDEGDLEARRWERRKRREERRGFREAGTLIYDFDDEEEATQVSRLPNGERRIRRSSTARRSSKGGRKRPREVSHQLEKL